MQAIHPAMTCPGSTAAPLTPRGVRWRIDHQHQLTSSAWEELNRTRALSCLVVRPFDSDVGTDAAGTPRRLQSWALLRSPKHDQ